MNLKKSGFSTRSIHTGEKGTENGALVPPIYQTAPFRFKDAAHGARLMSGKEKGYVYSRSQNPTTEVFEEKIADLEAGRLHWRRHQEWRLSALPSLHQSRQATI